MLWPPDAGAESFHEKVPDWNSLDPLVQWYQKEKRDLPWRRTSDPYAILVSETMLQQTRVETVIPYYHRFLEKFPTLQSLAEASTEELNLAWAGLGYYRRVHNLQRACQRIVGLGYFPQTPDELAELPGIGAYTAAAVSSIAFSYPALALDGNALRVLSRWLALDLAPAALSKRLRDGIEPLISPAQAGDFTQALMELGARLCLPRNPRCLVCPWQSSCQARARGEIEKYPRAKPKRARQSVALIALRIYHHSAGVWLEQRPDDPFLAGQWVPPWFELDAKQAWEHYLGKFPGSPQMLGKVKHSVTFRDLDIEVWGWSTESLDGGDQGAWQPNTPGSYPALTRKVLRLSTD